MDGTIQSPDVLRLSPTAAKNKPSPLPGTAMPDWRLYQQGAIITPTGMREIGVRTPAGEYFHLQQGEEFVAIREGDGRVPSVRLPNGQIVRFDAWRSRLREDRKKIFDTTHPMYGDLFFRVVEDFPELDQLNVVAGTKKQHPVLEYTGGFYRRPDTANPNPSIVVYVINNRHYDRLIQDRELSARTAAQLIGIDFEALRQHPDILARFIFLHEIGHAQDYITHYQNDPRNGVDTTYNPVKTNQEAHARQMNTLPYPGWNPADIRRKLLNGELAKEYEKYHLYFQQRGINSPEELATAQEIAYRNLPKESYADQFAARMLRKHWKTLGLDKITGTSLK